METPDFLNRSSGSRSITPNLLWGQHAAYTSPRPYSLSSRTPTPEQWSRGEALRTHLKTPPRPHSSRSERRPDSSALTLPAVAGAGRGETATPHAIDDTDLMPEMRPRTRQAQEGGIRPDAFAVRSWAAPPTNRAVKQQLEGTLRLLGGSPRPMHAPFSAPARPAPPWVSPHNAWCTFVEWRPPADGDEEPEFQYDLKVMTANSTDFVVLRNVGKESRAQLHGLEPRVVHYFQVRGRNRCGDGPWSTWSEGYMAPELKQGSHNSSRISSSQFPTSAVLTWEEPCGHGDSIIGYRVQYGTDPDKPATQKTITVLTRKTSVQVSDLRPNTLYYFRVQALNETGESAWTDWSDGIATKALEPEAPTVPSLVKAGERELELRWRLPVPSAFEIVRFDVIVAEDDPLIEAGVHMEVDGGGSNQQWTLTLNDLTPNTTYYAKVRAWSPIGASEWSGCSDALRTLPAPPEPCEEFRVAQNVTGRVVLEWRVPESYGAPVTSFLLRWHGHKSKNHRDELQEFGPVEVPAKDAKRGALISHGVNTGVQPGHWVRFDVAARSAIGLGSWSDSASPLEIRTCADKPSKPSAPFVTERTADSLQIDMLDVTEDGGSPILYYELQYSTNADMTLAIECKGQMWVANGEPQWHRDARSIARHERHQKEPRMFRKQVTKLVERGPYYFCVRAVNEVGKSDWSVSSAAAYLKVSAPAKMAAPTLAGMPNATSLLIGYSPPADLGSRGAGRLHTFELRYSRDVDSLHKSVLERLDVPMQTWNAPTGLELVKPEPVVVRRLLPGRTYAFQVRALSALGSGPWSDVSEPFEVHPSVPEKPEKMEAITGSPDFPPHGIMLHMKLPEHNGRLVQKCQVRILGPYAKWRGEKPEDCEWKDFCDIEPKKDFELTVEHIARDSPCEESSDPDFFWLWSYRVLRMGTALSYKFSYRCANECGWSAWSDDSNEATTSPDVPQRCSPPKVVEVVFNRLALCWDPPPDTGSPISEFILQWATNPRWENPKEINNIKVPNFTLEGLTPKTNYYVRIAAVNSMGPGHFSETDPRSGRGCFSTPATVPDPPTDVVVFEDPEQPSELVVKWNKPLSNGGHVVSRYKIFYSLDPDMSHVLDVVAKGQRSCRLNNLRPNSTYYVQVSAINTVGVGPRSEQASGQTPPVPLTASLPPKVPDAPELLLLIDEDEDAEQSRHLQEQPQVDGPEGEDTLDDVLERGPVVHIKVSWKCPENYHPTKGFIYDSKQQTEPIKSYSVEFYSFSRADCDGETFVPEKAESVQLLENLTQVRDRRLVPKDAHNVSIFKELKYGYFYFARVKSHNSVGDSAWSVISLATRTPSWKPDSILAVRELEKPPRSLRVEWDGPAENGEDITHYEVQVFQVYVRRGSAAGDADSPDQENKMSEMALEGIKSDITRNELVKTMMLAADECKTRLSGEESGGKILCDVMITGLIHATFYMIKVRAINAVGSGRWGTSERLRTLSAPPVQMQPTEGVPDKATTSSVTFSWNEPDDIGGEMVMGYEVRWVERDRLKCQQFNYEDIVNDTISCTKLTLEAHERQAVAEGLTPGNAALPILRCWNKVGYSPWSVLPDSPAEIQALSCLPVPPAETTVAPYFTRTQSGDHRLYWLSAHFECPALGGRDIRRFTISLRRQGVDDPRSYIEYTMDHPGGSPWFEGQKLSLDRVHPQMEPGEAYVLHVRATSEVGEAAGWGVPSEPELAPADYPDQPAPPKSPWQWPTAIEVVWTSPNTKGAPLEQCALRYSESTSMTDMIVISDPLCNKNFTGKSILIEDLRISSPLYYFQVRVRNAVGWSSWSAPSEGYGTGACRPEEPQNLAPLEYGTKELRVHWERPDCHGRQITEYEVMICEPFRSETFQALVDKLNACGEDEEAQGKLISAEPPSERTILTLEDLDSETNPTYWFEGLLGGQGYSATARARNCIGWSDWCKIAGPMLTKAAVPEAPRVPVWLGATQVSLNVRLQLPYDGGDRITLLEVYWNRVEGPIDRHIALGGTIVVGHRPAAAGIVPVEVLPVAQGGPAEAPPSGHGGFCETTLVGLEPGSEYELKVRALNFVGPGPFSELVRMTAAPGVPDAPLGLRHTSRTDVPQGPATVPGAAEPVASKGVRAITIDWSSARPAED
eukprot:TRINITY_DN20112_c2_g4_i1.p1 TRINITY_DN20112_c2_g4~~TRINITY_DN20112_c2_g4_i1.p1  ORF type:complete len:2157 (+),score=230.77 TRINITY_DN20112_c2_g4_i1:89-6472(+)